MSNATFNGVALGDFAWLQVDTKNQVEIHIIPRADGSIVRRRGGGVKTMSVHGWIIRDSRTQIEQFFDELAANLSSAVADLIINNKTFSNCVLDNISPSSEHNRWARFTITFIKSG